MTGILFLAHRLPFPPDRGDKIRSHHILKALAELAPVHVGCFADSLTDVTHESELARLAKSHFMPMRSKPLGQAALEAIVRGKPVSLTAFAEPLLAEWVTRTLARHPIDTIYVFSGQMGQYVPADWQGRLIVDLVDVDSAKFEAYARQKALPSRWVNAREGRLLRRFEDRLAARADHTLLVSEAEATLLSSRVSHTSAARIGVLGNGIDAEAFNPRRTVRHGGLGGDGPHLVFTGQMNYPPNIAAALRVVERLMPPIRTRYPHAEFHVIGREPAAEVAAWDGLNGARVWGEVPDVRPFLAAADLVLAPLVIARGVQNKVLEAMAMARPVVMTSAAATGLPGEDGVHFAVADSDAGLVERALGLLASPLIADRMGKAARRLVVQERSWPAMLAKLPALVGRAPDPQGRRHAA